MEEGLRGLWLFFGDEHTPSLHKERSEVAYDVRMQENYKGKRSKARSSYESFALNNTQPSWKRVQPAHFKSSQAGSPGSELDRHAVTTSYAMAPPPALKLASTNVNCIQRN